MLFMEQYLLILTWIGPQAQEGKEIFLKIKRKQKIEAIIFRLNGNNADLTMIMDLGSRSGGKIEVSSMDLSFVVNDMKAQMECQIKQNIKFRQIHWMNYELRPLGFEWT